MQNLDHIFETAQYWDLVPAVVGGVIGALAGGVPAWLIAKRQSDESLRRDRESRIEKEKALAFSVAVKLLQIINSTIGIYQHVKSCMALRSLPDFSHMEPWQVLTPMIGLNDEESVTFSSEEMTVFLSAKEYDFMQDIMLLSLRHSSTVSSFREYCNMRNQFRVLGPKPQTFDGEIGQAMLSQADINAFKVYTIPLNNVASGVDSGLDQDVELAKGIAGKFGKITKEYFKVDSFMSLSFPSEEDLAARREPRDPR